MKPSTEIWLCLIFALIFRIGTIVMLLGAVLTDDVAISTRFLVLVLLFNKLGDDASTEASKLRERLANSNPPSSIGA